MVVTTDRPAAGPLSPADVDAITWSAATARPRRATAPAIAADKPDTCLNVVVFCGGRGSATIIRELTRWPQIHLSLLVNAYDDGLSTGQLREFIPNMLGPSDFRKNLSHILDLCSGQQYALRDILEYRLPKNFSAADFDVLLRDLTKGTHTSGLTELHDRFRELDGKRRKEIIRFLLHFWDYYQSQYGHNLSFADCSLGNLIFAGCYLDSGKRFNHTVRVLSGLFGSKANLINVSCGENRILAALKQDGQILSREADIVGPQNNSPIQEMFLLEHPLSATQKENIQHLAITEKACYLRALSHDATLSPEAEEALLRADLIIYGPGTQFSSLLPSYRIARSAIHRSPARSKIFVANLDPDHDIQSLTALDLVDRAFEALGDPQNQQQAITHILFNRDERPGRIALDGSGGEAAQYKSARIVTGVFANPAKPKVHSGYQVVRTALAIQRSACATVNAPTVDIYVDLLERSLATEFLLQEFMELPWNDYCSKVRLRVNRLRETELKLPENLQLESTRYSGLFTDVDVVREWLKTGDTDFLVTITGDGEYRLSDVLLGIQLCENSVFGAVLGSRNQSRRQFWSSLRSAYGKRGVLHGISWLGAFVFAGLFAVKFRLVLSDPLTGFRIYQRSKLTEGFRSAVNRARTTVNVTELMISNDIEIAEIPVNYRTFESFTKPMWRLWRGVRNLLGCIV